MKTLNNGVTVIILSSFLFACGSGGGGSSGSGVTNRGGGFIDPADCVLPTEIVAITSANAEQVVSEVKAAIQTILAFGNLNATFIELNNSMVPSNPFIAACDMGGEATINFMDNGVPFGFISANDILETDFTNCVNMGETSNGEYLATYNAINEFASGEAGLFSSTMDWSFTIGGIADNLSVNDSNINVAVDGDSSANVSFNALLTELTSQVTSGALTFSASSGECVQINNADFSFGNDSSVTTNPSTYFLDVNALQVASTILGGTVEVSTVLPIVGMENFLNPGTGTAEKYFPELDDATPPTTGVILINGNNSNLDVLLGAGGMVEIEVDEDLGIVGPENIINTTWSTL